MDLMKLTKEDVKACKVFSVRWYPPYGGDCEPHDTWVLAPNGKMAMDYPKLKRVQVTYARLACESEAEEAMQNHWCDNDPDAKKWW